MGEGYQAARGVLEYFDATRGIGHTSLIAGAIKEITKAEEVIFVVHERSFGEGVVRRFELDPKMVQIATLTDFRMGTFAGTKKVLIFDNHALYQLVIGLAGELGQATRDLAQAEVLLGRIHSLTSKYSIGRILGK